MVSGRIALPENKPFSNKRGLPEKPVRTKRKKPPPREREDLGTPNDDHLALADHTTGPLSTTYSASPPIRVHSGGRLDQQDSEAGDGESTSKILQKGSNL